MVCGASDYFFSSNTHHEKIITCVYVQVRIIYFMELLGMTACLENSPLLLINMVSFKKPRYFKILTSIDEVFQSQNSMNDFPCVMNIFW